MSAERHSQQRAACVILLDMVLQGGSRCRRRGLPAACAIAFALGLAVEQPARAQQPAAGPPPRQAAALSAEQATILTNGWAFLAQGNLARAAEKANQLLVVNPRQPAAFALALEVEIARAGARSGAEAYARWIGSRTIDEPVFMRRVAFAILEEAAAQPDSPARLDALSALANGGDIRARTRLAEAVARGDIAEARMLAAKGDEAAVRYLSQALGRALPNPVASIQALGESRSRLAVPALTARLTDARPEVRGAVAEALGKTADRAAVVPQLRAMLNDPSSHVRVKAAAALHRLDDSTGVGLLREMAAADSARTRLAAVEAMTDRPDANWEALVRSLTTAAEPEVRLAAARLAGRFDPGLAAATLQTLSADPNPAISGEASRVLAADVALDLPGLRSLLRHEDPLTRVAAAAAAVRLTN